MAAEPLEPDRLLSRHEVQAVFGCSGSTVDNWRRAGAPHQRNPRGAARYPLAELVKWRLDQDEETPKEIRASAAEFQLRKLQADTERSELDLLREQDDLVEIDAVVEVLGEVLDVIRTRLRAVPGRYCARLIRIRTAGSMKKHLREIIDEVLNELSSPSSIADTAATIQPRKKR